MIRNELLAVVKSIEHYDSFLYERKFYIRKRLSALKWLLSLKSPDGQLAQWVDKLQSYNFEIPHWKRKSHGNANNLSRRPCSLNECKFCCLEKDKDEQIKQIVVSSKNVDLANHLSRNHLMSEQKASLAIVLEWRIQNGAPLQRQEIAK